MGPTAQEQGSSRELVVEPKPLQGCLQGEEAEKSGGTRPRAVGAGWGWGSPVQLWAPRPGSQHPTQEAI